MTELRMLIGLPASGKTRYADMHPNFAHVSSDVIRQKLFSEAGFAKKEQDAVFDEVYKEIIALLKEGRDVIYDATNLQRKYRMEFLRAISGIECKKRAVLFMDTLDHLKEVNAKRENSVPEDVYDRMIRYFDPPMKYEGFDDIEIEWADHKYNLFPYDDFGILNFIDQENSHHKDTIGKHMIRAAKCFKSIWGVTDRYYGYIASLYHDVGKPFVKCFANHKGEKTKDAHYYNHEHVGAYLFLLIVHANKTMNFTTERELYVADLIDWHMRPMNAWVKSTKAMQKDRKLIGEEMFTDLIRLYCADTLAQQEALIDNE